VTPEPRANPLLFGHAAAEAEMAAAMRSGRMHHAWLLTGPEGAGKATLAYRFARRLFAGIPAGDSLAVDPASPVFRRVAAGSHADLRSVERAFDPKRKRVRGEIVVDDVRAAVEFLALTPAEGGWRVVVVDGAEHLNRNAANALLKILEEPPKQAVLLLVCAAPGRLLPTIRSRCRRLRLGALDAADMDSLLQAALPELPAAERARLALLSEGSPGRAIQLADEQGVALAGLVDGVLQALPDLPPLRAHEIADMLWRSETGFATFFDLLCAALAQAVRKAARGAEDGLARKLAAQRPLDAWCDVWHALTQLQNETERFNLDKRHAVVAGLDLLRGT
jgi:DNA polymerase-3 subunit delta'